MLIKHHYKKDKKVYVIISVGFLIIVALFVGYYAKLYPVAKVGSDFIPYAKWSQAWGAAQKLDSSASKDVVFNQFLINKQKEFLAYRFGLVNSDSIQNEQMFYKTGNESAYNKLLGDYFSGNENLFVSTVVEPLAYDAMLRIKYNTNFSENNDAYNKAQNILNKLALGQTFEDLAKQYSDDQVSGQLGGDVGFVNENQVLPELKNAMTTSTLGQVDKNIIISREGYHVIWPIEVSTKDNVKTWHLKQILIKTTGYDAWLSDQLKTVGTHQLMKI